MNIDTQPQHQTRNIFGRTLCVLLGLSLTFALPANAAVVTLYTDRVAWEAAVEGTVVEETFDDATLIPGLSFTTDAGVITGGVFDDELANRVFSADQETTWSFSSSVSAWGADFDTSADGGGTGIDLVVDIDGGEDVTLLDLFPFDVGGPGDSGFRGVISDMPFSAVTLFTTPGFSLIRTENYDLDNMVIVAMPEPSRALLSLAGFGAVALRRRRAH